MNLQHLRKGEVRKCEVCGKETYWQRTLLKRKPCRTCSHSCAAILKHREGWSPTKKGFRGYGIKYGKNNYRVDAIRKYGAVCLICGYDEDVRLLDVDHKDDDHSNHRIDNLQVLCVMCHAKITRKVVLRNKGVSASGISIASKATQVGSTPTGPACHIYQK